MNKETALSLMFAVLVLASAASANPNWTGTDGRGISLTILAPQATGLAEEQGYIPALVQGEFVSNFSTFSAISVLDWEQRDALLIRMISGAYSDSVSAEAAREIGNAIPTTHFMQGSITKTATGYSLQMNIIKTADKTTAASFSRAFTFAELDNLTAIRQASLDMLEKMGVTLTENARLELAAAAAQNHVTAQTALARGVTAQRQGTEVAALSYYFQAAAFDPSLLEAVNRSSILTANISSGSMGDNIRNEIQWRRQWVERLTEMEQFVDKFAKTESMPYTLSYLDTISQGAINFQNETVTLSIETRLSAQNSWVLPIERTLQAVYDGLRATGKTNEWGLRRWPRREVTNMNAFAERRSNFAVVFELINSGNKVIGRQTLRANGSWGLDGSDRPSINVSTSGGTTVNFQDVNVDDITDNLTIRVASVNGTSAETAVRNGILQIRAISRKSESGSFTDSRDEKSYRTVRIGILRWMVQNLNYQTNNSWCYDNNTSNCAKYGRLYTWDAAMSACPSGWRLPTREDWNDLVWVAGGNAAGTKLKSKPPNWNGTDDYGFSALPGGRSTHGLFDYAGSNGYWWSATEYYGSGHAWGRYMYSLNMGETYDEKGYGFSVRCVQDISGTAASPPINTGRGAGTTDPSQRGGSGRR